MEQADDGRFVSPPAAHNAATTAMPISTALSHTASSSHSRSSIFTSNDVVGIANDSFLSSCPTAVNVAAPALHALEQEMLLYRVDPQGAVTASSDGRKRRMIKNRESAARSRARKQAYTHELEKEVRLLHAENDALREQCEELKAAVEVQVPVKKTLQRLSSAPF